jgi:hypothetical protein
VSASIFWEPVDPKPKRIGCWAPSSFMGQMERAGFRLPTNLDQGAIPVLRGMAAMISPGLGTDGDPSNPFQELIDKIEKHGTISIWAEH